MIEASYNWILWAKKLISGIVCHGTFEINHGQPWFILNVPWQRMQLISFYKICTIESPFEERCYYGTLILVIDSSTLHYICTPV